LRKEVKMRIILASASPRRRELLEQIGIPFEVHVSCAEERVAVTEPAGIVEELSKRKASAVLGTLGDETGVLVIGADTVVAIDGGILGKPGDESEAACMLRKLSGREHQVYTGVTLLYRPEGEECLREKTFYEVTRVFFYSMTEEEILAYVATGDPMDKAGAYGIQGICARYIKGIEGDYSNVVGLPVGRLYQELREIF